MKSSRMTPALPLGAGKCTPPNQLTGLLEEPVQRRIAVRTDSPYLLGFDMRLRELTDKRERKEGAGRIRPATSSEKDRVWESVLERHKRKQSITRISQEMGIPVAAVKSYLSGHEPADMKVSRLLDVPVPLARYLQKWTKKEDPGLDDLAAGLAANPEEAYYMKKGNVNRQELKQLAIDRKLVEPSFVDLGLDAECISTIAYSSGNPLPAEEDIKGIFHKYPKRTERDAHILEAAKQAGMRGISKIPFQLETFVKNTFEWGKSLCGEGS